MTWPLNSNEIHERINYSGQLESNNSHLHTHILLLLDYNNIHAECCNLMSYCNRVTIITIFGRMDFDTFIVGMTLNQIL